MKRAATAPLNSKLGRLFAIAVNVARRTGRDQRCPLTHGAAFVVRVRDGVITVRLKRKGKRLGDTELETFKAHFGIPPGAERIPAEGQEEVRVIEPVKEPIEATEVQVTYFCVAFRWKEEEAS